MTKSKHLSIITIIITLLFFSEINAYADVAVDPVQIGGMFLIVIVIPICVIALISWLIIRSIKRRKSDVNI